MLVATAPKPERFERTMASYPRHETHLTQEEATQAQIRSYVASGMVPPRFESFEESEAAPAPVSQKVAEAVPRKPAPVTAPARTQPAVPNVTREAPSLEPPTSRTAPVKASVPERGFLTPPPLENFPSAPQKKTTAVPPSALPATGPIATKKPAPVASAVSPSTVRPPQGLFWTTEAPSMEVVAPAQVPVASKVKGPPPLQYTRKKPSEEPSSLPSLAQMLAKAGSDDSERVH